VETIQIPFAPDLNKRSALNNCVMIFRVWS